MTINQINAIFPTHHYCINLLEEIRWKGNPVCPYCKSANQTPLRLENRFHCNICNTSYSVTVGTMFHKTKCSLQQWFLAIYLLDKEFFKISLRALSRQIKVTKETASYMIARIKRTLNEDSILIEMLLNKIHQNKLKTDNGNT